MQPKPITEILLWSNCNNNCDFCISRKESSTLTDKERVTSLLHARNLITYKHTPGNHLMICGGELFDTDSIMVRRKLISFLDFILSKIVTGVIDLLYLNTNLIYRHSFALESFLYFAQKCDCLDRVRFTTSYDPHGRFSINSLQLFNGNIKYLKETYPELPIVTNTILTKNVCEDILSGEFDLVYNDTHFLPLISLDRRNLPTRNTVFNTLTKIFEIDNFYKERLYNEATLKQERIVWEYNKEKGYENNTATLSDCGHPENFKHCFYDSDACYYCEVKKFIENL